MNNKILIELISGKWLINDKQYSDLSYSEKLFFDEFLIASRIIVEAENYSNRVIKTQEYLDGFNGITTAPKAVKKYIDDSDQD